MEFRTILHFLSCVAAIVVATEGKISGSSHTFLRSVEQSTALDKIATLLRDDYSPTQIIPEEWVHLEWDDQYGVSHGANDV